MSATVAVIIVLSATTLFVGAMLLARRFAAPGGYFRDSDRVIGVLTIAGTSLSVLLAFVFLLAFESYGAAKEESGHEATAVLEQFRIAQLFEAQDRDVLQSELICYARGVVSDEWRRMEDGGQSSDVDTWVVRLETSLHTVHLGGAMETTAFGKFFDESIVRDDSRSTRLREANGVVPAPMWLVLVIGTIALAAYTLMLADPSERAWLQCAMVAAVVLFLATPLLMVNFLDHPFSGSVGSLEPSAMRYSLAGMERERTATAPLPCGPTGAPLAPSARHLDGIARLEVRVDGWPAGGVTAAGAVTRFVT